MHPDSGLTLTLHSVVPIVHYLTLLQIVQAAIQLRSESLLFDGSSAALSSSDGPGVVRPVGRPRKTEDRSIDPKGGSRNYVTDQQGVVLLNKNGNPIIRRRKRSKLSAMEHGTSQRAESEAPLPTTLSVAVPTESHLLDRRESDNCTSWPDAHAVQAAGQLYTLASTWMKEPATSCSAASGLGISEVHIRLNIQPEEVLCAMLLELQHQSALQLLSADKRLSLLQLHCLRSVDEEEGSSSLLDPSPSLLDVLLRCEGSSRAAYVNAVRGVVSFSRGAAAVCGDSLSLHRDATDGFDSALHCCRKEAADRCRRRYDSLYSSHLRVVADDVPPFVDRVPNPFSIGAGDPSRWDWLTSPATICKLLQSFARAAVIGASFSVSNLSEDMSSSSSSSLYDVTGSSSSDLSLMHGSSNAHPFIHSSSPYFTRVCAKQCIHNQFSQYLTRPVSDDQAPPAASEESEAWARARPQLSKQWDSLSDEQLWAHYLFRSATTESTISDDSSVLSSSALVLQYEDDWTASSLRLCVHRVQELLSCSLGLNVVLVDKCARVHGRFQQSLHRAVLSAASLSRFIGREPGKQQAGYECELFPHHSADADLEQVLPNHSKKRKSSSNGSYCNGSASKQLQWGPILVVAQLQDIPSWECGLSVMCDARGLQLLPYYGSDTDRAVLRSYFKPPTRTSTTGLYTDRSHCQVVLSSYETLLQDLQHFSDLEWCFAVFDEAWGLVSNRAYLYPWTQMNRLLHCRHRLFPSSSLSHCLVDASGGGRVAPGVVESAFAVCPFALGVCTNFSSRSSSSATPHTNLNSSAKTIIPQPAVVSTVLNSVAMLGFNSSTQDVELSELSMQFLTRLLATLTVVYDDELLGVVLDLKDSADDANTCNNALLSDIAGLAPYLEWSGVQLVLLENPTALPLLDDGYGSKKYFSIAPHGDQPSTNDPLSLSATLSRSLPPDKQLLFVKSDLEYSSHFVDADLDQELDYLNIYAVGMVGPSVQRLKASDGATSSRPDHPSSSSQGGGRGGRGRGRGGGRGRGSGRGSDDESAVPAVVRGPAESRGTGGPGRGSLCGHAVTIDRNRFACSCLLVEIDV